MEKLSIETMFYGSIFCVILNVVILISNHYIGNRISKALEKNIEDIRVMGDTNDTV